MVISIIFLIICNARYNYKYCIKIANKLFIDTWWIWTFKYNVINTVIASNTIEILEDALSDTQSEILENLSDMTKLLVPLIANDFPSFNQEQLFSQSKNYINKLFKRINL